ncbi:hypothetical protein J0695_35905 [Streptomyces beijiangensis]|uniref:Regulatory protein n=1 Tax=Streptomyces beijiangensis TaxID=163361 RepID=A0A939FHA4_9ACTN|nr:hypothetical protein [Streptomyces beijiangensis]
MHGALLNEARGSAVFGIVRPCTHRLTEGLKTEWMAHLCGLCLALRGDHGQFARVVTNYDGLIVSVLTEAQSERSAGWRRTAGPCPLRGMRTAPVAQGEGARLAAAVSLVLASAKVRDHVADRDGWLARRPVAAAARRVAAGWDRAGARTGAALGFDTAVLVDAVDRQTGIEALAGPGTPLLTVTEPTETATAAAFAHTAVLAGRPGNAAPLAEAGRLFGRLAHLLDAVEDRETDAASGAWNPLAATGTDLAEARRLCDDALHGIRLALRDAGIGGAGGRPPEKHSSDGKLAHVLLAHELQRSVDRAFGASCAHRTPTPSPFGPPPPGFDEEPEKPSKKRGLLAGCAMAVGLFCTCQVCCANDYEGPWSRKRREGCCNGCDGCDCPCDGCDCDGCDCCCPCDGC